MLGMPGLVFKDKFFYNAPVEQGFNVFIYLPGRK
jgi:hypothetical protein